MSKVLALTLIKFIRPATRLNVYKLPKFTKEIIMSTPTNKWNSLHKALQFNAPQVVAIIVRALFI